MISIEEIKMAQDITGALDSQKKAVLVVSVDENYDIRLISGGMEEDITFLLDKVANWCERRRG